MVQLFIYLVSAGLVVLGALGFIAALNISGKIRAFLACLAACVPIAVGVWLFHSSGLRISDFGMLVQATAKEAQGMTQGLKDAQEFKKQFQDILK